MFWLIATRLPIVCFLWATLFVRGSLWSVGEETQIRKPPARPRIPSEGFTFPHLHQDWVASATHPCFLARNLRVPRWSRFLPMFYPFLLRVGLVASIAAFLASTGCQGPAGYNLGTHVGVVAQGRDAGTDARIGTGMPREIGIVGPRRTIDEGVYLYHEPATGKTAPFKVGMSLAEAEKVIRVQGIVATRRTTSASSGPTVYVLGPERAAAELTVLLHFANEKLVFVETPA
jgi:hypothetical protein